MVKAPPALQFLSLEQSLNISTSYSYAQAQGRVYTDPNAFYIWTNKKRVVETVQLNVASAFTGRQQFFLTTSLMHSLYKDSIERGTAQHLADTLIGYTYEAIPEYAFSYWKPNVFVSILMNLPTGKSIYDHAYLSEGADVTGHNQWGAGLGLTLRKVVFPLTITLQGKAIRLFSKRFADTDVSGFYDTSLAILTNYATNYWDIALNLGLTFNHLTPRTLQQSQVTSGSMQNATVLIGAQKSLNDTWNVGLTYADQTLIGQARNSILNRTFSININYNYF